jgi:hypothetical protein
MSRNVLLPFSTLPHQRFFQNLKKHRSWFTVWCCSWCLIVLRGNHQCCFFRLLQPSFVCRVHERRGFAGQVAPLSAASQEVPQLLFCFNFQIFFLHPASITFNVVLNCAAQIFDHLCPPHSRLSGNSVHSMPQ